MSACPNHPLHPVSCAGAQVSTPNTVREFENTDLAVMLIRRFLVKGLRASTLTRVQDRFAFAIQELLRVVKTAMDESDDNVELLKWRFAASVDVHDIPGVAALHLVPKSKKRKRMKAIKARKAQDPSSSGPVQFPAIVRQKFLDPLHGTDAVSFRKAARTVVRVCGYQRVVRRPMMIPSKPNVLVMKRRRR